ncbi:MAG: asparagine synthase (glutamine-hydrolyzing) [Thermoleophilaceae bacterium]
MCGIGGTAGGSPPDIALLERMAGLMAHRGPDGKGVWRDGQVGFAHTRLAIIDLDERSDQPMHLGPLHLVFNGEIYNYRELRKELCAAGHEFRTEGDAEVLLHAWAEWGEGALDRLNGMFAFAVWDDGERTLTLARDAFGEKPLHWAQTGERLLFASDVRALIDAEPALAGPREEALGPYLARGLMPAVEETFFAGIRQVPAAHVLRVREGRTELRRWWAPRAVEAPARYEDAVERVRELLLDSVRLRLRSDVPVGTSLSGGVDSSAVVGLSAQIAGDHRRHAFTARFPGFERDEWRYASAAAQAAGVVEHHGVEPTGADLLADLDALVSAHGEPVVTSSIYAQWRVMRAAREAGVTVLLDGQGADELFGGYVGSEGWALRAAGPGAALRTLARGTTGERRALLLAAGAERLPAAVARRHRLRAASPYAEARVAREAATTTVDAPDFARGRGPLVRELSRQAFHTSMPMLLRYADRNSMAHSREVRLPYLDRRLAELALSLPPEFLYRGGARKAVLRDAARGVVPDEVLERRDKVGFETPERRWLHEPAAIALVGELLLDGAGTRSARWLDRAAVEADVRAGAWRDHNAVWRALNLELWLRGAAVPAAP